MQHFICIVLYSGGSQEKTANLCKKLIFSESEVNVRRKEFDPKPSFLVTGNASNSLIFHTIGLIQYLKNH